MNAIRDWALDSERDWVFQAVGARWPFVLAFVVTGVFVLACIGGGA